MITFLDTFTGPDGSLAGHVPEIGSTWNLNGNTFLISSNEMVCGDATGFRDLDNNAPQYNFYCEMEFKFPNAVAQFYFVTRRVDGNNADVVQLSYDNATNICSVLLFEIVGGVQNNLASTSFVTAEDVIVKLRLLVVNLQATLKINDTVVSAFYSTLHNATAFRLTFNMTPTNGSPAFDRVVFADSPVTEGAMINLRTGQFNLHREGVAKILEIFGQALCAGTALAVTAEVRLFTSANAPGCDDVADDYTEATFSGYGPVVIDSGDDGCTDILEVGVDGSGIGQLIFDQQAWTEGSPATITETITGCYVVLIIGSDEFLLATLLFDNPAQMAVAGDILKVNGFALLDCQMAEVP